MSIRDRTANTDAANRDARARYIADKRRHEQQFLALSLRAPEGPPDLADAARNVAGFIGGMVLLVALLYWTLGT